MPTTTIKQQIAALHSGNRPPALVNVVGTLLFSTLRIDPANPTWRGADALFYSEGLAETVQHGLSEIGFREEAMPQPGFRNLTQTLERLDSRRSAYCLMSQADAERFPNLKNQPAGNVVVFAPIEPVDGNRWQVVQCGNPTPDSVSEILRQSNGSPLWIISPIEGERPFAQRHESALPPLAGRMNLLGTETAFDVLAEVHKLRAEGRDILSFGLGEPDFDTPSHIKDTAKKALDQNETHYGPSAGNPELRAAIARYIQRTRHIPCEPDEVVVTPGAKPILFDAMMALVNPGEEVLYPSPGYPIYESVINWIGAKAIPLPLLESKNWNFLIEDFARLITPRTKMVVLNTPGNPTGTMIGPEELREIARLANEYNFWVIADEVYSQIIFEGEFHSIASYPGMKERSIIVDGFSKTFAMTGWRMGFGVMNRELATQIAKIETNIDSCTCSFSQIAGISAMEGPWHETNHMVEQFKERSRVITDELNNIDGVRCLPAQGAFYVFPNVTGACRRLGMQNANELQRALLHEAGVAVLPRTCFGSRLEGETDEYLRLSFATSMENIREGLRRMKQFIER